MVEALPLQKAPESDGGYTLLEKQVILLVLKKKNTGHAKRWGVLETPLFKELKVPEQEWQISLIWSANSVNSSDPSLLGGPPGKTVGTS